MFHKVTLLEFIIIIEQCLIVKILLYGALSLINPNWGNLMEVGLLIQLRNISLTIVAHLSCPMMLSSALDGVLSTFFLRDVGGILNVILGDR